MAKSKSKAVKKQQKAQKLAVVSLSSSAAVVLPVKPAVDIIHLAEDDELIAEDEIEITVDVLNTLLQQPEVLSNQRFKQLKRVGWDFGKILAEQGSGAGKRYTPFAFDRRLTVVAGSSIHSKISHSLSLSLYRQALVHLFDLYVNKTPTKLGSLQRWVRDCDATSRPGRVLTQDENEERNTVLKCLDMVLRVCGGAEQDFKGKAKAALENLETEASDGSEEAIRRMKVWDVRREVEAGKLQDEVPLWALIQKGFEGK